MLSSKFSNLGNLLHDQWWQHSVLLIWELRQTVLTGTMHSEHGSPYVGITNRSLIEASWILNCLAILASLRLIYQTYMAQRFPARYLQNGSEIEWNVVCAKTYCGPKKDRCFADSILKWIFSTNVFILINAMATIPTCARFNIWYVFFDCARIILLVEHVTFSKYLWTQYVCNKTTNHHHHLHDL